MRDHHKFADDETNTPTKTVLLMKIGGGNRGIGIHGTHLGPGVVIRYGHSDEARQTIPWVEYDDNGRKTVYAAAGAKPDGAGLDDARDGLHRLPQPALARVRPAGTRARQSHGARTALARVAVRAQEGAGNPEGELQEPRGCRRPDSSGVRKVLPAKLPGGMVARQSEVTTAAKEVLAIYDRNIFPDMKVTWGKYPVNIGHTDFPGCFRCHDGSHNAQGGQSITQDCNACHNLLAMDEANPKSADRPRHHRSQGNQVRRSDLGAGLRYL